MAEVQRHDLEDEFDPKLAPYYVSDYEDEEEYDEELHGQVATDAKFENVVKELIHNSRRLDGDDITVSVHHADISLHGTVRTEEEKMVAGSLAQLVHGIGIVKNELIVKINEGILPSDIGRHE